MPALNLNNEPARKVNVAMLDLQDAATHLRSAKRYLERHPSEHAAERVRSYERVLIAQALIYADAAWESRQ